MERIWDTCSTVKIPNLSVARSMTIMNRKVQVNGFHRRIGILLILCGILATIVFITLIKRNRISVCDKVYKLLNGDDKNRYFDMFYEKFSYYTPKTQREIKIDLPKGRARLDNRKLIRIYDFIRVGEQWEEILTRYDVCLATQTSIERLYWLPRVLETWNSAPLSIAVHIVNENEWLALNLFILFLERCYPTFRDHVAMHMAVPIYVESFHFNEEKLRRWNVGYLIIEAMRRDCTDTMRYLTVLLENFGIPTVYDVDNVAMKTVFPHNHLRNIARKGCPTYWTYSVDIDIIPSERMAEMLQEYFQYLLSNDILCPSCAYVIPTFELNQTKWFPMNKSEIVGYYNSGAAIQYHGYDLPLTQEATDYLLWTETNLEEGQVFESHDVQPYYDLMKEYEPFYVSPDYIPPFDERFLGYGQIKKSQFQEALLSGWKFSVLTPVFAIHWGINLPQIFEATENMTIAEYMRYNQTETNRELYEKTYKDRMEQQQQPEEFYD